MNRRMLPGLVSAACAAALALPVLAAAAEPAPLADGKALYERTCAACHPLERSLVKQLDREGWRATIRKMIANGAKLDEAQGDQVLGYLAAKSLFETKCNGCHELAKPLAAIKDPEAWRATVGAMAAKKPGLLAPEEALAISQYLALVRPAK